MFKLVIQDDEGKTTVVPLIRDEITIGRKEGNTIRLTERNVSRRHARIVRNNGEVQIEDLGSYNGIRVNNARIAERVSLRVSDQVQIGDYKLYLKAEGVEQADDARTMPLERIEPATDVMPAVNAAPTAPIVVPAAAAATANAAAAARAGMAVADTDPQGRPVATASQVAALSATAQYGRLVVVSSNFAGKEFELSRPQMIVGRTEENDIVVNHRSISRNHAKLTRDPESGRYTISDLQSSNGVRVNGQDYGKVELRRGDTIDLGHVRMRFVEPGEDFVFARDAEISNIGEGGSKRGMLVAIILAVVVLGAVGAFFALKGGKGQSTAGGTNDHHTGGSAGSDKIAVNVQPGSDQGSNEDVAPPDTIDAGKASGTPTNPTASNDDITRKRMECKQLGTERKWPDMSQCALELKQLDPASSGELVERARKEQAAEIALGNLNDAIRDQDLGKARKIYNQIDDDSVYHKDAKTAFDKLDRTLLDDAVRKARGYAARHKCDELDKLVEQVRGSQGDENANQVAAVKCSADTGGTTVVHNPGGNGSGTTTTQNPGGNSGGGCDASDSLEKGKKDYALATYGAALAEFEAALKCKPDPMTYRLAALAACKLGKEAKAKAYFPKVPGSAQPAVMQTCAQNKPPITLP